MCACVFALWHSIDVEEALYEAAMKRGITCITISQRLTLPAFHKEELKLGENTASGLPPPWHTAPRKQSRCNHAAAAAAPAPGSICFKVGA